MITADIRDMEPSTILGEMRAMRAVGGRACPVANLRKVADAEHLAALEVALGDPIGYPSPVVAQYFRKKYPDVTLNDKAVRQHVNGKCRCFR